MQISATYLRSSTAAATLALLLASNLHAQTNLITDLLPPDPAAGKLFGSAVALDGAFSAVTTASTSDPKIAGAVEVFRDDGLNGLVLETRIESPPWSTSQTWPEGFGSELALDGGTLLIGNSYAGLVPESRNVYVYRRDDLSGTWALEGTLEYPGTDVFPLFGRAVDIEGDVAIVGAPFGHFGSPTNDNSKGEIYVYQRSGTTWSLSETLSLTPTTQSSRIGYQVKILGDRIFASANSIENQSATRGAVVFVRSTGGAWTQEAFLGSLGIANGSVESLDYDGRTVVLSIRAFGGSFDAALAVVCYRRSGTTYARLPDINTTPLSPLVSNTSITDLAIPADRAPGLAIRGDRVYVGTGSSSAGDYSGTIEVFENDGSDWQLQGFLHPPGLREGDLLGIGMAQDEGRLLVSAIGREDLAAGDLALNSGAAYLFRVDVPSLTSYCQATPLSCTSCPCGNNAAAGTATGCTNSSGVGARLVGSGEPLPLADSLRFDLEGATPSSFAFLAVGTNSLPNFGGACPPGSGVVGSLLDGKRCIGGGLRRLGLRAVDAQGSVGATNTPWGGGNAPAGGIVAASGGSFGATLYYQAFYRDNGAGSCGTGVNTSNGVRALLLP